MLLKQTASLLMLGTFDHLLGAVFGFVKGMAIVEVRPHPLRDLPRLRPEEHIHDSMFGPMFLDGIPVLLHVLPVEFKNAVEPCRGLLLSSCRIVASPAAFCYHSLDRMSLERMPMVNSPVLVLNQNYEPLNVCNARRAFVLVDRGKAEVLEHNEGTLRSPSHASPSLRSSASST